MMNINCRFTTETDKERANKLGIPASVVSVLDSLYIENCKKNNIEIPEEDSGEFFDGIKKLYKEYESKVNELKFYLPLYRSVDNNTSPLLTIVDGDSIIINKKSESNFFLLRKEFLDKVKDQDLQQELSKSIDNKHLLYDCILWYSMDMVQNGKKHKFIGGYDLDSLKVALNKLNEYKNTTYYQAVKNQNEHFTETKQYLQNSIALTKAELVLDRMGKLSDNIEFDSENHVYYVKGKRADFSVSEKSYKKEDESFGDFAKRKKEEKEKSQKQENEWANISLPIGDSHDTLLRDYLSGINRTSYPNMTDDDVVFVKGQADNMIAELKKKHGANIKIITNPKYLQLAASIKEGKDSYLVAGTMDVLVFNDQGDMFVYDFKTFRANDKNNISTKNIKPYNSQLSDYVKMLKVLFPEYEGKIYAGGFLQYGVKYEAPQTEKQKGYIYEVQKNEKGERQVYVRNPNDNSLTPIQNTSLSIAGKDMGRIYSPGEYIGVLEPEKRVNDINPFSTPEEIKDIVPIQSAIKKEGVISQFTTEKQGRISSKEIYAIKNGEKKFITRYGDSRTWDYWSNVKPGDLIEFHPDKDGGESIIVRAVSGFEKIWNNGDKIPSTDAWKKNNAASNDDTNYFKEHYQNAYQLEFEYVGINVQGTKERKDIAQQKKEEKEKPDTSIKDFKVSFNSDNAWVAVLSNNNIGRYQKASSKDVTSVSDYEINSLIYKSNFYNLEDFVKKNIRSFVNACYGADAIFAVGTIGESGWVQENVKYGCQYGIKHELPVYVLNTVDNKWYQYNSEYGKYIACEEAPILTKNAACISVGEDSISDSTKAEMNATAKRTASSFSKSNKSDSAKTEEERLKEKIQDTKENLNANKQQFASQSVSDANSAYLKDMLDIMKQQAEVINRLTERLNALENVATNQVQQPTVQKPAKQEETNLTSLAKAPKDVVTEKPQVSLNEVPTILGTFYNEFVDNTPHTRMEEINRLVDPKILSYRKQLIAHDFFGLLQDYYYEKLENFKEDLNKAKEEGNTNDEAVFAKKVEDMQDPIKGMQYTAQAIGVKQLLDEILEDFTSRYRIAIKNNDEYKAKQYKILIDYFPEFINLSAPSIEKLCYISINMKENYSVKEINEDNIDSEDSLEEKADEEDDEESVSGNDGWGFKVKYVNPHNAISSTTKMLLRNRFAYDNNTHDIKKDDLGMPVYLDENVAHNILLSEMRNVFDVEDFCVKQKDEEGDLQYDFPFFEKLSKKYPWVKSLIFSLNDKYDGSRVSQKVSALYHDLCQTFVKYQKVSSEGKIMNLNEAPHDSAVLNEISVNFKSGQMLHPMSIYNGKSEYNYDNIVLGIGIINDLKHKVFINGHVKEELSNVENPIDISISINKPGDKTAKISKNFFQAVSDLCKMIGFDMSDKEIQGIFDFYESREDAFKDILLDIDDIYDQLKKNARAKTIKEYDFTTMCSTKIKHLGSIMGVVKDNARLAVFRQGKKQYSSYNPPSFLDNLVRRITDKKVSRRDGFFQEQFKKFRNFYEYGKGWKGSTHIDIYGNSVKLPCLLECLAGKGRDDYAQFGDLRKKFNISEILFVDQKPFEEWGDRELCFNEWIMYGDSDVANTNENITRYNMPISADSNHAKYFVGQRFFDEVSKIENPETGEAFLDISCSVEEKISTLLARVAIKEIERMDLVNERAKAIEKGEIFPIENFDGKRGRSFCFLPFLNENKEEILREYKKQPTQEKQEAYLANLIQTHYLDEFDKYFDKYYPLFYEFSQNGQIRKFETGATLYRGEADVEAALKEREREGKTINKEEWEKEAKTIRDKAALREFYFNRIYNQSQIIELVSNDLAFFKSEEDFQKRDKEKVSAGYRPNTNSEFGRKTRRCIYIEDPEVVSNSIEGAKSAIENAQQEGRVTADEAKRMIKELEEITPTDGQTFTSFNGYRAAMDMIGLWHETEENAYQNIIHNKWTYADMNVVLRVLKSFVFTYTTTTCKDKNGKTVNIHVPTQIKNSEFPLLACYQLIGSYTKSPKLMALSKFMEEHNIDTASFHSGIKEGCYGQVSLDVELPENLTTDQQKGEFYENILKECCFTQDETGAKIFNPDVVHEYPMEDFTIVQPTPPHAFDEKVNVGSQMKTIIENALPDLLPDKTPLKLNLGNKSFTKDDFVKLYDSVYKSKMLDGYKDVLDFFGNIESLQAYLIRQVKDNPKYGPEMMEALQLIEYKDPKTGEIKKDFNIPIGYPSIRKQIESIMLSAFKNNVIKIKTPGAANVLVADWNNELEVKYKTDPRTGKTSLDYVECYMPWYTKQQLRNFLIRKQTKKGAEYYEIDYQKIEREAPELLEGLGYRIPTEAQYSILPLKIKGFLPQQYGSSIMLPSDITKISGSDFDVDKLFIMLKHWEYDFKTGKISVVKYDLETPVDKMTAEQRDNLYIDMCFAVMKHPYTTVKFLHGGNFDRLKKCSRFNTILKTPYLFEAYAKEKGMTEDEIKTYMSGEVDITNKDALTAKVYSVFDSLMRENLSFLKDFVDKKKKELDPLTPDTYMYLHKTNACANALIGYYAISSMGHLKMKDANASVKIKGSLSIDGVKIGPIDHDSPWGEDITANQAENIDAAVDAVKDNALAGMNQNENTAGITNALERIGLPKETIGILLNHPALSIVPSLKYTSEKLDGEAPVNINLNIHELMLDILLNRTTTKSAQDYVYFMNRVVGVANSITSVTQVNRADTPSGAAPSVLADVIRKILNVHTVSSQITEGMAKIDMKERYVCKPDMVSDYSDFDAVKKDMKTETLPQAGFSLGMESIIPILGKHISYLKPQVLDVIARFNKRMNGKMSAKQIDLFLNEFNRFLLSGSAIMQDDNNRTFYEKRNYYLNEFPKWFKEKKKNLTKGLAMNFIYWNDKFKDLRLDQAQDRSKDFLKRLSMEFESFLLSDDVEKQQIAVGLYMYCLYTDRLKFGPNNFGQQFTSRFVSHLPSVIQRSRQLSSILEERDFYDSDYNESMNNFLKQFDAYYWKSFLSTVYLNYKMIKNNDGSIHIPKNFVLNSLDGEPLEAIRLVSKQNDHSFDKKFVLVENQIGTNREVYTYIEQEMPEIKGDSVYNCFDTIENIIEQCSKTNKVESNEDIVKQNGNPTVGDADLNNLETFVEDPISGNEFDIIDSDKDILSGMSVESLFGSNYDLPGNLLDESVYSKNDVDDAIKNNNIKWVSDYGNNPSSKLNKKMC